jgi:hypothetical protein
LALLPSLYVLPQGICLQHGLRVLEQLTNQGPHQGIYLSVVSASWT